MADQATIFTDDKSTEVQTDDSQTSTVDTPTGATSTDEALSALVGEGRKYKTVEELAKAYVNADSFIDTLKAENRELKEQTTSAKTIDDVLERLSQQQHEKTDDKQAPSVADITKLVEQAVTGLESKRQKESNLLQADALMKEAFGEKAADKFNEVAATPELKRVYMDLAAADPSKFVALFGVGTKGPGQTVDTGSGSSTASYQGQTRTAQFGTKEYFDNVRKTDPKKYYSQAFQVQMDKAVRTDPHKYYGR